MDFSELINRRQSCRNFSTRDVSREDILACLEAARLAPSACNAQPFHITVCTGETARETAALTQGMGMNKFTGNAPCFLVISEESYNFSAAAGNFIKDMDFRCIDIGIASAQIVLCAESGGLATCLLGWFNEKKLRELLGIKNRIRLVIAMGYASDGDPIRPKVRKKLDELADFK